MTEPRPGDDGLSKARLAAIVTSSDDVIVSKTLEGVITSWNPAAERILGWTAEEAIGQSIFLIIPDDRREEENEVLARLRRGERIEHFDTIRRTKDGRRIELSITVSPIRNDSGQIVGASKVARDISERRRTEMRLQHLAAVVESSEDAIVSKTLDGRITSWNPAAERTFGWTADEAVGRSIMLIVPDDCRAEEEDVLARIRRGERVDHYETRRRTKDGRVVDMAITVSPVRDATGRLVGASKVARDISVRRRLEEQRAQLLAREQAARREAERLGQAKDELLATVSHELRTPLNSIFGWARMLQGGSLDEAGRQRAIETILRSVSAQARLVDDLLDLSRIAVGKMRLQLERMDLNATIAAAVEAVRPAARAKDIALAVTLDESVGFIQGAPDRLQQVIWNLLSNSVKFTPGGGRVEISSRREPGAAIVVVKDTGRGIPPEVLPHIFEPFRQEDSSLTRDQGGLGLGLTLVRRLLELHGGQIRAESPGRDRGATFTLTLPVAAAHAPRRLPEATGGPGRALEDTRILVVDDDPEFSSSPQ